MTELQKMAKLIMDNSDGISLRLFYGGIHGRNYVPVFIIDLSDVGYSFTKIRLFVSQNIRIINYCFQCRLFYIDISMRYEDQWSDWVISYKSNTSKEEIKSEEFMHGVLTKLYATLHEFSIEDMFTDIDF